MEDKKQGVQPIPSLTPAKPPQKASPEQETIVPPKEYHSKNGKIKVIIDGDTVTMDFDGKIAEDVGCYRNVKLVRVQFQEGQGMTITPMM